MSTIPTRIETPSFATRIVLRKPWLTLQVAIARYRGVKHDQEAKQDHDLVRIVRLDGGCAYNAPGRFLVETRDGRKEEVTLS